MKLIVQLSYLALLALLLSAAIIVCVGDLRRFLLNGADQKPKA